MAQVISKGVTQSQSANRGEQELATLFANALPKSYRVLQGVELYPTEDQWDDHRGEADFVILHPNGGVIVLEVKGLDPLFNAKTRKWEAIYWDSKWKREDRKDPFEQARLEAEAVQHTLIHSPVTRLYAAQYRVSHAVWVPYMHWDRKNPAADAIPNSLILDATDLQKPEAALMRVCGKFLSNTKVAGEDTLSEEAIDAAVRTLERTNKLKYPSLLSLHKDGSRIAELTMSQSEYIESFFKFRKLAIPGAAGTGKTVLAIEMAWRLAEHGNEVLLVCANPFLVSWIEEKLIRKQLTVSEQRVREHLKIHDIQSLCEAVAKEIGQSQSLPQLNRTLTPAQFLHRSMNILRKNDLLYDALIIDEGQEITAELWSALEQLKRPSSKSSIYFFYDEAQRETADQWTVPIESNRIMIPLKDNVRNTRHIFGLMMKFYVGDASPTCRGPLGTLPTYVDSAQWTGQQNIADGEVWALERQLDKLIMREDVLPEDILVVTCRPQKQSRWYETPKLGQHNLTWQSDGRKAEHIAVSTIRSAKGLERKCVILTELDSLDQIKDPVARQKKLYIAISRALLRIVVFCSEQSLLKYAATAPVPSGGARLDIQYAS